MYRLIHTGVWYQAEAMVFWFRSCLPKDKHTNKLYCSCHKPYNPMPTGNVWFSLFINISCAKCMSIKCVKTPDLFNVTIILFQGLFTVDKGEAGLLPQLTQGSLFNCLKRLRAVEKPHPGEPSYTPWNSHMQIMNTIHYKSKNAVADTGFEKGGGALM